MPHVMDIGQRDHPHLPIDIADYNNMDSDECSASFQRTVWTSCVFNADDVRDDETLLEGIDGAE